jgi:hypothetical protein
MAIPIWEDEDVEQTYVMGSNGEPQLLLRDLSGPDLALMTSFIEADEALVQRSPSDPAPSEAMWIRACARGVAAFENMSPAAPVGWKKFVLYQVGEDASFLWRRYQTKYETSIFADWVMMTINGNGWGPDGNRTPLGEQHSWSMALGAESGGGVRPNPVTGKFEVPTGDAARHYNLDAPPQRLTLPAAPPPPDSPRRGLFRRR